MAPKTKQGKMEWIKCPMCQCYFTSKDLSSHTVVCTTESNEMAITTSFYNTQCFVGCAQLKSGMLSDLPESEQEFLIFLHPETLKLLDLFIGGSAVFQHTHVVTVWPDQSLNIANVGINQKLWKDLQLQKNDYVVIHEHLGCDVSALSIDVHLSVDDEVMVQRNFMLHLKNKMEGKTLTAGNRINSSFYGKPYEVIVSRIQGIDCKEVTIEDNFQVLSNSDNRNEGDTSIASLSQSMLDFSLGDSFVTSSPIRTGKDKRIKVTSVQEAGVITSIQHVKFFLTTEETKINIMNSNTASDHGQSENDSDSMNRIGGYNVEIKSIQNMLNRVFVKSGSESKGSSGFKAARGLLIYGPSGCGKTMLVKALVKSYKLNPVYIKGPDIWSKFYGESEAKLKALFKEARAKSPSVIVLEELESICPKRESSQSDIEKRVQTSLLTLIDEIVCGEEAVFLLAVTSNRDRIEPSLRRPGRLDTEVELGVPTSHDRTQILEVLLKAVVHSVSSDEITAVAQKAHGFVGADMQAIVKQGGVNAAQRCSHHDHPTVCVTKEDLMAALQTVQPSAMREVAIEVPDVKWSDIGGQGELKHKLKQAIEWPLKHPEAFQRLGIRPPKGLLMYGPPGCSKTMIAKALANESGINFIAIKGPELFSKWVGESERAVRDLFRKARSAAPAVIFFDEIDALAGERGSSGGGSDVSDRVLAQLLTEIDGVEALKDVTIVAATNRPDRIDKALLRPGRLDRIVFVPLPDNNTRKEIFLIKFRSMPVASDVCIESLVERTSGYSGAEVTAVCHEAALNAMQEDIDTAFVYTRHFDSALALVTPRITSSLLEFYESYASKSGLHSL